MKYLLFSFFIFLSGCAHITSRFDKTELHVIGVYEGTDPEDDGKPWWSKCKSAGSLDCHQEMTERKKRIGGEVIVNISITENPIILALTSYDKTKWIIKTEGGVKITKVILGGYHAQSIQGIDENVPIEVYTYDSSPCSKCFQGQGYFYSYNASPGQLQKITGLKPSSFQGKYTGKEFSIFPEASIITKVPEQKNITTLSSLPKNEISINSEINNIDSNKKASSQKVNKNNAPNLPKHRHQEMLKEAAKSLKKEDKITASNINDFREFLTDGQLKLLKINKAFFLDIHDEQTGFSPILKSEYIPYPEPKTGEEVMWNHLLRFRGHEWERTTNSFAYYKDGHTSERYVTREEYLFKYNDPNDPIYQRVMIQVTEPPRAKGEVVLKHLFREGAETGLEAWQYLPGTRRVRKAPNLGYDFLAPPDGIETLDMADMFSGPLDRYDWKIIGKREIYTPVIDKPELLNSEANKSLVDFTRHQKKEVWVIEATLKPDNTHTLSRRVFYVDSNSWHIVLAEHYNSENQLVKFSVAKDQYYADHQSLMPDSELHYDFTNEAYVINQHFGYKFYLLDHLPESYFTVQQVRHGGCKR